MGVIGETRARTAEYHSLLPQTIYFITQHNNNKLPWPIDLFPSLWDRDIESVQYTRVPRSLFDRIHEEETGDNLGILIIGWYLDI